MLTDLRVAARALRHNPAFTWIAIGTLALGIGANTAMFSIVNAVLLRPLPGYETDRIVRVRETGRGDGLGFVSPRVFERLRAATQSFEELAGMQFCQFNLTGAGEAEQVVGPCTTANWFEMQRARAMLGRTFLPDEDKAGRNRVVVLDHGFWQQRFGGDRGVLGRTLIFDQQPWVIIGVMPPEFRPIGVAQPAIYTPYVLDDKAASLYVAGRLKPGVALAAAREEMAAQTAALRKADPALKDLQFELIPVLDELTGPRRPLLLLLMGAVALVSLIACVNVANLLLARSAARRNELAIRVALGASPTRIVRFILAEAIWIAAASAVLSVLVASIALKVLKPLVATLPRVDEIGIDAAVLGYTLAVSLLATLLFGLAPALQVRRGGLQQRTTARWQGALVAAEVALAFVLVAGAGLLMRTFAAQRTADLGYNPHHVLTHFLSLNEGQRETGSAVYGRIRDRVGALPGVRAVATTTSLPMGGVAVIMDVQPDGQPARRNEHPASLAVVSDHYFRAAGIALRDGRPFLPTDRAGTAPVAIVSESIARRYFGGRALGRRLVLPQLQFNLTAGAEIRTEIVGVVGDISVTAVGERGVEHIYLPESQASLRMTYLMVRTDGDPMALANAVREVLKSEAPASPPDSATTLEQRSAYLTDAARHGLWLLGAFAFLALSLSAIGIYGVTNYLAGQRRREMGIRMALGASFGNVAGLVYADALRAGALGLAAGLAAAAGLVRFLEKLLYGVRPFDPATLLAAAGALLLVLVVAAAGPALRSALTDPAAVLRHE